MSACAWGVLVSFGLPGSQTNARHRLGFSFLGGCLRLPAYNPAKTQNVKPSIALIRSNLSLSFFFWGGVLKQIVVSGCRMVSQASGVNGVYVGPRKDVTLRDLGFRV